MDVEKYQIEESVQFLMQQQTGSSEAVKRKIELKIQEFPGTRGTWLVPGYPGYPGTHAEC
eukprot:2853526-Rhodomonas_salina.1